MEAFWRGGYEGTSVCDLVEATGLQKGSLYKAFGDKHALYMRVLDRYLEAGVDRIRGALEGAEDPLEALAGWLLSLVGTCGPGGGFRGCMAVNASVELGPADEAVRHRVALHVERVERLIEATVERGRQAGRIRRDVDPRTVAEHLMTLVGGLMASGRGAPPPDRARRVIEHVLAGLAPD
jgi:TetR/AcrR family transcriptional repressor of nem operon